LGLLFLAVSHSKKENEVDGSVVRFASRGIEAGFSFREIDQLRQIATQCNIDPPITIFDSREKFDKCIHHMVRNIKMSGGTKDQATHNFLSKLYDYRQKVEIAKPDVHPGINNSRQISEGQAVRILVQKVGVFESQVVKNTGQYMTVTRPEGKKIPPSMMWMRTKISVYFQREDDAGYVFDSEVLDEVFSLGIPSLKITQGESLFRTQKRKSIRTKIHKPAFLYLVQAGEPPHRMETGPGLKCSLENISDTGYAVTVGGRADAGLKVKVQFALDNAAICITGTVRSVSYDEFDDRSLMHIEAEALPPVTRNRILGEVFGMLPDEDEDELPFRVLESEMADMTGDRSSAENTDDGSMGDSIGDISANGDADSAA
jgi:c-di-GMP-binding flagellar brake protein YcgR